MRAVRLLLLAVPGLILAASLAAICLHFHSFWPWRIVVHEDGKRTLLETVFYFEHALGELPVEIILAIAVAGAALRFAKPRFPRNSRVFVALLLAAISVDATLVIGAWRTVGPATTELFLLQYHTRDGASPEFGSHWRYHLLSEASLMLLPAAILSFLPPAGNRRWSWAAGVAAFLVACLIFGVNRSPSLDARYLGHQARETFTHALVTIPLALWFCLSLSEPAPEAFRWRWPAAATGCGLLMLYQVGGVVLTGSREHAQTHDLVRIVCSHFFEHTFSYLVVPIHAALFYLAGQPS
jgi:hypothetical protein